MTAEDAIDWVNQNAKQIAGYSRKYLPYAPYDQEDLFQDAYEAALEAVTVSEERQVFFPGCFWLIYKGKISAVTPNPDSKSRSGSSTPPQVLCDSYEFSTRQFSQEDGTCHSDIPPNIDIDHVYPFIRQYMTTREEQILETLLGIHGGTMKIKETARHLECSPANVRQALNRVCQRISLLVSSGELDAEFVESEIMKQFGVMSEIEKPAVIKSLKTDIRKDAPSIGRSQKSRPRVHRDLSDQKKMDIPGKIGIKTHPISLGNYNFGGLSPATIAGSYSLLERTAGNDIMSIPLVRARGIDCNFTLEDLGGIIASSDSTTVRSTVSCPQYEPEKGSDNKVISLFDRRILLDPTLTTNSKRNRPLEIALDRHGGGTPANQDRSPPTRVAMRKGNLGQIGRDGPLITLKAA